MNDVKAYQTVPFERQIAYFGKKINLPTDSYADVSAMMHDYAFVVAGANTAEMVADFRRAMDRAITEGQSFDEFKKHYKDIAKRHQFDDSNHRAKLIYTTNLYASYNHGRYEQQSRLRDVLPYWQYQHNDNANPRLHHKALDGVVYRADDPWWQSYYPPRGYNCHCTVRAYDDKDLERYGLTVSTPPPIEYEDVIIGKQSGRAQLVRVPKGVTPGFEAPKQAVPVDVVDKLVMAKLVDLPPPLASTIVSRVLDYEPALAMLNQSVAQMVDRVANTQQKRGEMKYVGVVPNPVIVKLEGKGIAPQSAVIAVRDEDVLHALRDSKQNKEIHLPIEFWRELPKHLRHPDAILLQSKEQQRNANADDVLLFIYNTEQGKVVVKMNYEVKVKDVKTGKKERIKVNLVRTASLVGDATQLGAYEVLWEKP